MAQQPSMAQVSMAQVSSDGQQYDLILIGSGMGALTIASLMAQLRHKRVLVLERHFQAGGFTHAFRRQNYQWDVGIHYVGDMGSGSQLRGVFDLITAQQVQWQKMPDIFEKFIYPDVRLDVPSDPKRYIQTLVAQFPTEARAIRQYFRDMRRAALSMGMALMGKSRSPVMRAVSWLMGLVNPFQPELTTQMYLDRRFKNPQLKALLTSQWGDYGLPPTLTPLGLHATIVQHYLQGGYYPVGGGTPIAESVQGIVAAHGGKFLLNREVSQVLIKDGRAVGVQARRVNAAEEHPLETYYAPTIVSNAGALNTYTKLIPSSYAVSFRNSLNAFSQKYAPASYVTLYLGLAKDPRSAGFHGENYWVYGNLDHHAVYQQRGTWLETGQPPQAYLSFPSLKDPEAQAHTAEVIAWVDYGAFMRWRDQRWRKRDADYRELKQQLAEWLLQFVDRACPGFADLVAYCEVSTPLTTEHFTAHFQGAAYGLPNVPEKFAPANRAWTHPKTPLPGLFITGADVSTLGIVGAMIGAMLTLDHLPDGLSFPQVFAAAAQQKRSAVVPRHGVVSLEGHC